MSDISKKEADAYDRMLDASSNLADLIESGGIDIDEDSLEELSIFLANNAPTVRKLLKNCLYRWP
jgi:dsDNA-binding SOS-regulon protein